jgi:hypothetical protein
VLPRGVRTDISEENQERQQDHDNVAVPNDEASVKLMRGLATEKCTQDTGHMKLTMNASKRIVMTRYRAVLITLNAEATLA